MMRLLKEYLKVYNLELAHVNKYRLDGINKIKSILTMKLKKKRYN